MIKNINAIDKIIAELTKRDYISQWSKYPESFKLYYKGLIAKKPRNYFPFSYTLAIDTAEAIDIKHQYIKGTITESEYKAFCLRHNLREAKA